MYCTFFHFLNTKTTTTTTNKQQSDGRGGADGGNQRFNPELSWEDNTNLSHAHKLLEPIKHKYGLGLSWGDLIVLAGTVAIEDMGGPVLGFAAGRIDHIGPDQTIALGPSDEQEAYGPVGTDGDMKFPLGANTMQLIYVNPEGKMGEPDPQKAADAIRDVFGRMGMDDRENVALIGGGHAIGKAHGAHTGSPGPAPLKCPFAPYSGKTGNDVTTSGLEGPWTTNPVKFDNEYYKNLVDWEWEKHRGPGGKWQWRVKGGNGPKAPAAHGNGEQDIMMLTTDVALAVDPKYRVFVEEFAKDEAAYRDAFAKVWYKLCNRDMGPYARMVGPEVPPPQEWQCPLPAPAKELADMGRVAGQVKNVFSQSPDLEKQCMRLALMSAKTYRYTDYLGGANGARIRFCMDWPAMKGLRVPLAALEPIKKEFRDGLSYADLIVLAGTVAVRGWGNISESDLPFTPGRTDAVDGKAWESLEYIHGQPEETVDQVKFRYSLTGLTTQELAALGYTSFHTTAALQEFITSTPPAGTDVYKLTLFDPEVKRWLEIFIEEGDESYKKAFAKAWTKLMTADLFDGPLHKV